MNKLWLAFRADFSTRLKQQLEKTSMTLILQDALVESDKTTGIAYEAFVDFLDTMAPDTEDVIDIDELLEEFYKNETTYFNN